MDAVNTRIVLLNTSFLNEKKTATHPGRLRHDGRRRKR